MKARLEQEGFTVEIAADGPSAVEKTERLVPDLVVLDLMLPGFDGLEVCRRIQEHRHVPVIMVTAKDSETDVLVGLGVGADDYITKPFRMREFVARVHALLRRAQRAPTTTERLTVADLTIDPARRVTLKAGEPVHLTATEFDLLHHLAANAGRVFSREQLLRDVWGYEGHSGLRTVDSHVRALRQKVGAGIVRTVHGVGYALGEQS
ncbi:MAG: response regulator transcription factor [Actinomycetota bacterium]|nr:response regulator transcription factor [Actinomycetota bacterium]